MKKTEQVVFKRYEMGQPQLLPPSVDELTVPRSFLTCNNSKRTWGSYLPPGSLMQGMAAKKII
jgi:hypothetical protein